MPACVRRVILTTRMYYVYYIPLIYSFRNWINKQFLIHSYYSFSCMVAYSERNLYTYVLVWCTTLHSENSWVKFTGFTGHCLWRKSAYLTKYTKMIDNLNHAHPTGGLLWIGINKNNVKFSCWMSLL